MILFGQIPLGARPDGSWPLRSLVGTVAEDVTPQDRRSRRHNPLLVIRGIGDPPVSDDQELLLLLHAFLEVIQ